MPPLTSSLEGLAIAPVPERRHLGVSSGRLPIASGPPQTPTEPFQQAEMTYLGQIQIPQHVSCSSRSLLEWSHSGLEVTCFP